MAVANSGLAMIPWGLVTSKAKRCLPACLLTCILGGGGGVLAHAVRPKKAITTLSSEVDVGWEPSGSHEASISTPTRSRVYDLRLTTG